MTTTTAGTLTVGDMVVNRMGFGAMRITGQGIWGPPRDKAEALRVLRRAVELGVNFVDTADAYGPNVSEELIAEALHPYPKGFVVATKGGLLRSGPFQWQRDGRPTHLREAIEGSLKRLRLERIDLYQLHAPDPSVPFEDSVGALAALQKQGKVRHIGLSNVSVDELRRAQKLVKVVSVQNRYNVGARQADDVLSACTKDGIAFLPWHPLAEGDDPAARLNAVASKRGATTIQVALAWLLQRSPVMLPIPGTSSVKHLEENVAADALQLTAEEIRSLEG